jgi:uracil-DNA glycosylase family 4
MDELELAAVTRAVVQRLTDFQRAGLSHWKRIVPVAPEPPAGKPPATTVSAATGKSALAPGGGQFSKPSSMSTATLDQQVSTMAASKRSVSTVASSASAPVAKSPFQPLDLPRDERVSRLNVLAGQVKSCVRCEELATCRTQTVFGVGNPEAKILFVGEAPGADEDKQGEPFVGRAGQLLNDIIKACRINREDIYICNVLRCRPPGNRLPSPEEAANCREYLDGQIAIVNPDYIVCWGSTAAKNLLASDLPIGKMRGKFHEYGRAKVLCTYHPSYLLRNPAAKKDVWEDMKLLFLDMGIDLTRK